MQRKNQQIGQKSAHVSEIDEGGDCGHGEMVVGEICKGRVGEGD